MLYNLACFYAIQGEPEEALNCLEKAVQLGFGLKGWAENDPDLNLLHSNSRFQALLERM
jgi:adenylate cyclase